MVLLCLVVWLFVMFLLIGVKDNDWSYMLAFLGFWAFALIVYAIA